MKRFFLFASIAVLMLGMTGCHKDNEPENGPVVITKTIDLHLHLDGAISPESARELAELQDISIPDSEEELLKLLRVDPSCRSLTEFLEKFDFPGSLMQTALGIETATYNLCEELKAQNVIYAELKFAPQLHLKNGLTMDEVVQAAIKGLKRSSMKANLILCCMRTDTEDEENKEMNRETIRLTKNYLGQGVCAADLAGAEALFPTSDYEDIFALANKLGVPFEIHAGEADGPSSVRAALSFGAKRIGHGVRSIEDPTLLVELAEKRIPLLVCPTSNLQTCALGENLAIKDLPIRKFLTSGINFCINTDDPSVEGTDLKTEWEKTVKAFSLTKAEVRTLMLNAVNDAFCSEDIRQQLRAEIEKAY